MADCKPNYAYAISTLLFAFFHLQFLSHPVAGDLTVPYEPTEIINLDCGSSGNTHQLGDTAHIWEGDTASKFFPSNLLHNGQSVQAEAQFSSAGVPYTTARLSHSAFTYLFPLTPGQKFIRLYFYSAKFQSFDRSKAVFSVSAGPFTLLRDFNAAVNANASGEDTLFREFNVYVEGNDQKLNLTFSPSNQDSYAFVSGIQIVSMPVNLYHTPPEINNDGGRGLNLVGQNNQFYPIENYTSLETVYRIDICGNNISPVNDTGMLRTWSADSESKLSDEYLDEACPTDLHIQLNHRKIPAYSAPDTVYQTARTMGPNVTRNKSYNLTWVYPVDPGFFYMIRLHFCEFQKEINDTNDRVFLIYIANTIAEKGADVFRWAGGKDIPYYRDYAVNMPHNNGEKKVSLSVKLQANPDDWRTRFTNVILNGIEIFKLNDSSGNLAGQNPDPARTLPLLPPTPQSRKSDRKMVGVLIPAVVGGLVSVIALGLFVFCRRRTFSDQTSSDGTSWWAPYSMSTNKSSKTRNSNLPSDLCRYFSLSEIKSATKNFDDLFIIGVGGFGNVYKGYIDDGATQVAIKRLKPGSKQGAHEFKTEIEMLSQLRHLHLVSLIGYCNDGNEMILVYDYMSHGTLRSHLYGDDEQPLTWNQRLQICIGAARGLHYLHTGAKHTIIHRDVKTTNILLDDKWVAKVSDFGLSKVGPTNMSKAHISTVVKGSFGYLDPEYYRRQQLTEKSDVYSFGVVLCEILCARPPLLRNADKKQVYLAEWVRRCYSDNTVGQIIDRNIKDEISPECLRKFIEIAVSCIQDDGIKRPAMTDVVWGLEFALQLQEASKKKIVKDEVDGGGDKGVDEEEGWLMGEMLFSSVGDGRRGSDSGISSEVTTTTNSEDSSSAYDKRMSGTVFSEIKNPAGR
ncbi:receptor-like protein kinase FERONIA [Cucurbita pepo subsp. pepo]|uniref:receptor-like protein kinase FERONIA n=1 Tax=Cucurbita pepo subsp. pepo TaxID=3664 RepID=UPI000C9D781C|nr:receptor-like protein kinase FERONIA [Cucurbita pepo subsp. pepo]